MSPALRIHLLLLLTLPALLLPRGLELGWCLCEVPEGVSCCAPVPEAPGPVAACCGDDEEVHPGPCAESEDDLDCPGCRSIEVQDFEEFLVASPAPELPAPTRTTAFVADEPADAAARRALYAPLRAPPGAVPPPGLLPGTSPLRI